MSKNDARTAARKGDWSRWDTCCADGCGARPGAPCTYTDRWSQALKARLQPHPGRELVVAAAPYAPALPEGAWPALERGHALVWEPPSHQQEDASPAGPRPAGMPPRRWRCSAPSCGHPMIQRDGQLFGRAIVTDCPDPVQLTVRPATAAVRPAAAAARTGAADITDAGAAAARGPGDAAAAGALTCRVCRRPRDVTSQGGPFGVCERPGCAVKAQRDRTVGAELAGRDGGATIREVFVATGLQPRMVYAVLTRLQSYGWAHSWTPSPTDAAARRSGNGRVAQRFALTEAGADAVREATARAQGPAGGPAGSVQHPVGTADQEPPR